MNTYSTSDIVLAATLKYRGHHLDRITITNLPSGATRGVFHFNDVPEFDLNEFDMGKCLVEPVQFNMHIRSLNAAIKHKTPLKK